jgi:hypothetical protein
VHDGRNQVSYYTVKYDAVDPEESGEHSFETDSETLMAVSYIVNMMDELRDGDSLTITATHF